MSSVTTAVGCSLKMVRPPHDYDVPLRVLSVTPTRDNIAAPGARLPDKHTRLFAGKTLDEWLMIQIWSSRTVIHGVFICETEAHRDRLAPMAEQYGITLMVRPRDMLHRLNDSGSIPTAWAVEELCRGGEYYTLVTTPLVVAPCRPPGFFDHMVAEYCKVIETPDFQRGQPMLLGCYNSDYSVFELDESRRARQLGTIYLNKNPINRATSMQHWLAALWWYRGQKWLEFSRHSFELAPMVFDIEPWMDIHIDTEEDWDAAEFWFQKKILSKGEDCYETYRRSWAG